MLQSVLLFGVMEMPTLGISVVINVRLYNSQDMLKRVRARKHFFTLSTHILYVQWLGAALHVGPKCWLSWKVYERRQYRRI